MSMASLHGQYQSRFFALPAELRLKIYDFLLEQPATISKQTTRSSERFCANILLTCRQANAEATSILYGRNVFAAHESLLTTFPFMILTYLPSVIHTRPVREHTAIKRIKKFYLRVRLDTDPRYTRAQVEKSFTGIEELDIHVFQAMFDSCSFAVLALFEGVRGVGKAMVRGSIGDGRYAAWLASTMMLPLGTEATYDEPDTEDAYFWASGRR